MYGETKKYASFYFSAFLFSTAREFCAYLSGMSRVCSLPKRLIFELAIIIAVKMCLRRLASTPQQLQQRETGSASIACKALQEDHAYLFRSLP